VAVTIVELVILCAIVWWGWLMIDNDLASYPFWQKTIALKIPYFVAHLGMFIGMIFMLLYTALHIYVLFKVGVAAVADHVGEPDQSRGTL
jgi:TRAP-type C4-dicarboxylate transport system permease small subunit